MEFEDALKVLKSGGRITREAWANVVIREYIEAQFPDAQSKMSRPYLFAVAIGEIKVPWLPSQIDLFANDWLKI